MDRFPDNWRKFASRQLAACGCDPDALCAGVARRRAAGETVFPPEGKIFRALELTAPETVKAVILGQDPYHEQGQAEGLAFSVPSGVKLPPSLRNIFKEYASDLGRELPESGALGNWAANGVLLLNSVLSVRSGAAGSHAGLGWERLSDAIISALSEQARDRIVFILWGAFAARKRGLVDERRHAVIAGAHPSPLSAYRGFLGSRPFSRCEQLLGNWEWPQL